MSVTNTLESNIPMTIYTLLKGEHREVSLILKTLGSAPANMRKTLFDKLRSELLSHAKAEQAEVYSLVKEKTTDPTLIEDAEQEHSQMERDLVELDLIDIESDTWMNKLDTLAAHVEHHVEEEENELFEEMKKIFSEEEAKAMAKAFKDAKDRELEKLA